MLEISHSNVNFYIQRHIAEYTDLSEITIFKHATTHNAFHSASFQLRELPFGKPFHLVGSRPLQKEVLCFQDKPWNRISALLGWKTRPTCCSPETAKWRADRTTQRLWMGIQNPLDLFALPEHKKHTSDCDQVNRYNRLNTSASICSRAFQTALKRASRVNCFTVQIHDYQAEIDVTTKTLCLGH